MHRHDFRILEYMKLFYFLVDLFTEFFLSKKMEILRFMIYIETD